MSERVKDLPAPLQPIDFDNSRGPMLIEEKHLRRDHIYVFAARIAVLDAAWRNRPPASLSMQDVASLRRQPLIAPHIDDVLSGFVQCSDDRFYEPGLSRIALAMWLHILCSRRGDRAATDIELLFAMAALEALQPNDIQLTLARRKLARRGKGYAAAPQGRRKSEDHGGWIQ